MKFETKAIHGLKDTEKGNCEWNNTINMASAYKTKSFGEPQDFEYGRVSNPTRSELEKLMAILETWICIFFRNGGYYICIHKI